MIENPLLTASTLAAGWLNDQRFDMKVIGREEHPTEVVRFKVLRLVAPPDQLTSFEYRPEVVWLTAFDLINEVRKIEGLPPMIYFDRDSGLSKMECHCTCSLGGLISRWVLKNTQPLAFHECYPDDDPDEHIYDWEPSMTQVQGLAVESEIEESDQKPI